MASTNSDTIVLTVQDRQGITQQHLVPTNAEYNVMEILKTFGYKMRATCGGMGLCADCHCRIHEGFEALPAIGDQEADTLDFLPNATANSRLACQIAPGGHLNGVVLELLGKDYY